jgi:hypothetical protein
MKRVDGLEGLRQTQNQSIRGADIKHVFWSEIPLVPVKGVLLIIQDFAVVRLNNILILI